LGIFKAKAAKIARQRPQRLRGKDAMSVNQDAQDAQDAQENE
jgi:hypothetical protein